MQGQMKMNGRLDVVVTRGKPPAVSPEAPPETPAQQARRLRWECRRWHARNWLTYRWRELPLSLFLAVLPVVRWFVPGLTVMHGVTSLTIRRGNGDVLELGVVGRHLITTAGKNYVASCFDNTAEPELLHFHGFGSGTTAAAVGNTTLVTEYTTEYATDNSRPVGSQAHSTNTYTTVATFAPDSGGTLSVTEWGLFSQASNAGGTLYDRQTFSVVSLVAANGDTLAVTYVLTLS